MIYIYIYILPTVMMLKYILLHTLSSHNLVHMLYWLAGNLSLYHLADTLPPHDRVPCRRCKAYMVLHFLTGFPIWPDDCRLAIGMKPMVVKECNVWLAPMYIYISKTEIKPMDVNMSCLEIPRYLFCVRCSCLQPNACSKSKQTGCEMTKMQNTPSHQQRWKI